MMNVIINSKEILNISIESVAAIITSIASFSTVLVAFYGLQSWKKQLRGKSEYELAKRLLVHIYHLRDAIKLVRNPWPIPSEIESVMRDNKIEGDPITDPQVRMKTEAAVYSLRWDRISDAFVTLEAYQLEAEAVWGSEIDDLLDALVVKLIQLRRAVHIHLNFIRNDPERDEELKQPYVKVLYNLPNEEEKNVFSEELGEIIKDIENYLKPKLRLH